MWLCLVAAFGLGVVLSSFTGRRDQSTLELPASSRGPDTFAVPDELLEDERGEGVSEPSVRGDDTFDASEAKNVPVCSPPGERSVCGVARSAGMISGSAFRGARVGWTRITLILKG
jgi:hypothetical protein